MAELYFENNLLRLINTTQLNSIFKFALRDSSHCNMVLRHFQTDALQDLCTEEQLDLLNSVDSLRSQGISHYISLPQIIVCGDQSSGKSSVLEAISGVSFPVKSSLCTRFPTELVLRKNAQVGVRVSIVPHQSRSDVERESLSRFCEHLDDFDGLPALIDNAKAAMGITTHGKAFSNDLLRVEISGPDRPHLTIVDLPGLIHSETKHQSAADVQLVQDVVRAYMKEPRSIVLAVISAKNDFANQIVLKLARDADPSGVRTLGVITKPDTLVEGSVSERMFLSLAQNQDVEFRLGWHVVKNMDTEKGTWTLAQREVEEKLFFSQGMWHDLPHSMLGVNGLRSRLSKVLLGQIAMELPSLIDEINSKAEICKMELQKLGDPRTTLREQQSYLLHISQSFQSLVKAAVDGTYNDPFFGHVKSEKGYQKRIRAVVQNLNEDFTALIGRRGHRYEIQDTNDKHVSKNQISITRAQYVARVRDLLKGTRGRELPGTFNPMIVRDLFLEQSSPWEDLTRTHITASWTAAREFITLAIHHVADEATSAALIDEIIVPVFESMQLEMEAKVKELLIPHQKGHPITYNHDFTDTLQKIRAEHRIGEISKVLQRFFGVNDLQQPYNPESIDLGQLLHSLAHQTESDMVDFASGEASDCMLAYYKVALKRFIDDIANEVIEAKLMLSLLDILSPVAVFDMPPTLVTRIAGESEEYQELREHLTKKLLVLEKGSETCKRFVGIRGHETNLDSKTARPQSSTESLTPVEYDVKSIPEDSEPSPVPAEAGTPEPYMDDEPEF
ncbi:P-loop containing nucleoside triphosphate hydrolase protein [Aspergillus taichungensis]|uniref:P-loop containing nucleoside triphosphate hydrolase protein n=1 Tax=Aspergillus taichungensis TaxID=482145 RepID=A0A2J5HZ08_9EURO|nr:P-loop containing nucleoside triphosphate hydrolase protein [Aspergillus taichungensis]